MNKIGESYAKMTKERLEGEGSEYCNQKWKKEHYYRPYRNTGFKENCEQLNASKLDILHKNEQILRDMQNWVNRPEITQNL